MPESRFAEIKIRVEWSVEIIAVNFESICREVEVIIFNIKVGEVETACQREVAGTDIAREIFNVKAFALKRRRNIYVFNQRLHALDFD